MNTSEKYLYLKPKKHSRGKRTRRILTLLLAISFVFSGLMPRILKENMEEVLAFSKKDSRLSFVDNIFLSYDGSEDQDLKFKHYSLYNKLPANLLDAKFVIEPDSQLAGKIESMSSNGKKFAKTADGRAYEIDLIGNSGLTFASKTNEMQENPITIKLNEDAASFLENVTELSFKSYIKKNDEIITDSISVVNVKEASNSSFDWLRASSLSSSFDPISNELILDGAILAKDAYDKLSPFEAKPIKWKLSLSDAFKGKIESTKFQAELAEETREISLDPFDAESSSFAQTSEIIEKAAIYALEKSLPLKFSYRIKLNEEGVSTLSSSQTINLKLVDKEENLIKHGSMTTTYEFQDADNDSLPNEYEEKMGLNKDSADSDGDGISDLDEIKDGTLAGTSLQNLEAARKNFIPGRIEKKEFDHDKISFVYHHRQKSADSRYLQLDTDANGIDVVMCLYKADAAYNNLEEEEIIFKENLSPAYINPKINASEEIEKEHEFTEEEKEKISSLKLPIFVLLAKSPDGVYYECSSKFALKKELGKPVLADFKEYGDPIVVSKLDSLADTIEVRIVDDVTLVLHKIENKWQSPNNDYSVYENNEGLIISFDGPNKQKNLEKFANESINVLVKNKLLGLHAAGIESKQYPKKTTSYIDSPTFAVIPRGGVMGVNPDDGNADSWFKIDAKAGDAIELQQLKVEAAATLIEKIPLDNLQEDILKKIDMDDSYLNLKRAIEEKYPEIFDEANWKEIEISLDKGNEYYDDRFKKDCNTVLAVDHKPGSGEYLHYFVASDTTKDNNKEGYSLARVRLHRDGEASNWSYAYISDLSGYDENTREDKSSKYGPSKYSNKGITEYIKEGEKKPIFDPRNISILWEKTYFDNPAKEKPSETLTFESLHWAEKNRQPELDVKAAEFYHHIKEISYAFTDDEGLQRDTEFHMITQLLDNDLQPNEKNEKSKIDKTIKRFYLRYEIDGKEYFPIDENGLRDFVPITVLEKGKLELNAKLQQEDDKFLVLGKVTDPVGDPVPKAKVDINIKNKTRNKKEYTTFTDEHGNFIYYFSKEELDKIEAYGFKVIASKPEMTDDTEEIQIPDSLDIKTPVILDLSGKKLKVRIQDDKNLRLEVYGKNDNLLITKEFDEKGTLNEELEKNFDLSSLINDLGGKLPEGAKILAYAYVDKSSSLPSDPYFIFDPDNLVAMEVLKAPRLDYVKNENFDPSDLEIRLLDGNGAKSVKKYADIKKDEKFKLVVSTETIDETTKLTPATHNNNKLNLTYKKSEGNDVSQELGQLTVSDKMFPETSDVKVALNAKLEDAALFDAVKNKDDFSDWKVLSKPETTKIGEFSARLQYSENGSLAEVPVKVIVGRPEINQSNIQLNKITFYRKNGQIQNYESTLKSAISYSDPSADPLILENLKIVPQDPDFNEKLKIVLAGEQNSEPVDLIYYDNKLDRLLDYEVIDEPSSISRTYRHNGSLTMDLENINKDEELLKKYSEEILTKVYAVTGNGTNTALTLDEKKKANISFVGANDQKATLENLKNASSTDEYFAKVVIDNKAVKVPLLFVTNVNKDELKESIDKAGKIKGDSSYDGVDDNLKNELEEALEEAKVIDAKPDASQTEVNDAKDKLDKAIAKVELDESVKKAEKVKESDSYTNADQAKKDALDKAIKKAEDTLNNADANKEEIDQANQALKDAIADITGVDKSGLNDSISKAEEIKADPKFENLDDALKTKLEETLKKAKEVNDNLDADQVAVDKAKAALDKAISAVKKAISGDNSDVNKEELRNAANKADAIQKASLSEELGSLATELKDALTKANKVLEDPKASQDEVDKAKKELDDVMAKIAVIYSKLSYSAKEKRDEIDPAKLSASGKKDLKALKEAINNLDALLGKKDPDILAIDDAAKAVKAAMNAKFNNKKAHKPGDDEDSEPNTSADDNTGSNTAGSNTSGSNTPGSYNGNAQYVPINLPNTQGSPANQGQAGVNQAGQRYDTSGYDPENPDSAVTGNLTVAESGEKDVLPYVVAVLAAAIAIFIIRRRRS